jgi:thymidylate synthase (FAD)
MNRTYDDMQLTLLRWTGDPERLITQACALTQKKNIGNIVFDNKKTAKLIKYLVTANHTSPFEHISITLLIEDVSRSFLAQITRHRMGSFTSASQHYTKYDSFPNILDPGMITLEGIAEFLKKADSMYNYCIECGIPKEEARQVLPNAKAVNIMWTLNARSLINFLNQRLCKRNVGEMITFAQKLQIILMDWFPILFEHIGPDCEMLGGCTQGQMKAKVCIDDKIPNFKRTSIY